ncbi:MAG: FAD-dependent monooxygenase [Methylocella sp.]
MALAPNGMRVLAALGLAEIVKAKGSIVTEYAFRNAGGALLACYPAADPKQFGEPVTAMSRAALFEALAAEMRRQDIQVQYQKRLSSIDDNGDRVIAHFEDGTSAVGDILIGTDGVRSTTRQHILPRAEASYTGLIGIGGFAPFAEVPPFQASTMTLVFGQRGFFGYSGGDTGSAMWWTNLFREKEFTRDELQHIDLATIRGEILQRFGNYQEPIPSLPWHTDNILRINVYDVLSLPSWHKGRVILIGDAAHAVSPNAGQGASMALEDAMYLAKLLRDISTYHEAFARFETERKPRVEKIVAEGRRRGHDKTIVGPLEQKIRELMMRAVLRLFGKNADNWLWEHRIDWE